MRCIAFILCVLLLNNAFAFQDENALLIDINAISLGLHKKNDQYLIEDYEGIYRNIKEEAVHEGRYFPEIKNKLKDALITQGFLISNWKPTD